MWLGLRSALSSLTGSQVRFRCLQGFLAGRLVFAVDVTLTSVQTCLQEGDLINPVAPVFALLISHAFGKAPVHRTLHRGTLPRRLPTLSGLAMASGWFAERTQTGWISSKKELIAIDETSPVTPMTALVIDADGHLTYMGEDGCRRQIVGDPELLARLQQLQGKDCVDGDGRS